MAGLVFLLVFWVLAGACQRHGVGGFLLRNLTYLVAMHGAVAATEVDSPRNRTVFS